MMYLLVGIVTCMSGAERDYEMQFVDYESAINAYESLVKDNNIPTQDDVCWVTNLNIIDSIPSTPEE